MTTPVNSNSSNSTADGGTGGRAYPVWAAALIALACSLIVVGTIVGNILVCTAVSIVRKLRTPSNWLIVSLAVADLLVGLLVMPLAIVHEVSESSYHNVPFYMRPACLNVSQFSSAVSMSCHSKIFYIIFLSFYPR